MVIRSRLYSTMRSAVFIRYAAYQKASAHRPMLAKVWGLRRLLMIGGIGCGGLVVLLVVLVVPGSLLGGADTANSPAAAGRVPAGKWWHQCSSKAPYMVCLMPAPRPELPWT
jgi:hypothetical protein